mmetsp:Transcript_16136/g.41426  ORF Transcript_16136/g.41426 Transcript_16136/m.41426 type:complete len:118 (+) Transcript_16136:11-364(+)
MADTVSRVQAGVDGLVGLFWQSVGNVQLSAKSAGDAEAAQFYEWVGGDLTDEIAAKATSLHALIDQLPTAPDPAEVQRLAAEDAQCTEELRALAEEGTALQAQLRALVADIASMREC